MGSYSLVARIDVSGWAPLRVACEDRRARHRMWEGGGIHRFSCLYPSHSDTHLLGSEPPCWLCFERRRSHGVQLQSWSKLRKLTGGTASLSIYQVAFFFGLGNPRYVSSMSLNIWLHLSSAGQDEYEWLDVASCLEVSVAGGLAHATASPTTMEDMRCCSFVVDGKRV